MAVIQLNGSEHGTLVACVLKGLLDLRSLEDDKEKLEMQIDLSRIFNKLIEFVDDDGELKNE